ncbi:MAG TPA: hypothetical protein VFR37_10555 [Longimicrobium sp.]|nr:hypothetical protein [Longimicrobium sp.]
MRLAEFRPGHVFWMERGATRLNEDKPRPFVLTTTCGIGAPGTLIYGSTQEAEAHFGAVGVHVEPRLRGVNRNGLEKRTVFYPGILIRERYERLPAHAGSVSASLAALRTALRIALGIGTGSCLSGVAPSGSRRGRVVRLEHRLARALRTRFAVILTQPRYSIARHYQLILPLLPDDAALIEPAVLRLPSSDWMRVFARSVTSVLAPIPLVHSIWHRRDIEDETPYVLDEASLDQIDQRLCGFFSLAPPTPDA